MRPTWPGWNDVAEAASALATRLPAPLAVFARIAFNYRWAWMPGGPDLFRHIDERRWAACEGNPVRLLQEATTESLARAARDVKLVERAEAMEKAILSDLDRPFAQGHDHMRPVAFVCAEYGIHSSLPIYSGGLGTLAGDFTKESSDQALPLVGIGLMYRQGYFHQQLDRAGWQTERWLDVDPDRLPAALVTGEDGYPLTISVAVRGRSITAQIWRIDVGRVPLYLLDSDRPENSRVDRWVTARLYVGDRQIRLAQYALLGVGGMRALRAMGIEPGVVHVNEGHGALAALELARAEVEEGRSFEEALAAARERVVFTTHTPVAAGNEIYTPAEMNEVLNGFATELGTAHEEVLSLGRTRPEDPSEPFGLTQLGIRVSRVTNAVSRVHERTAKAMWHVMFPTQGLEEVPITHVTNGVHVPTWMAPSMRHLLDEHLGAGWAVAAADPGTWTPVKDIPDEELWAIRNRLRRDLVNFAQDQGVLDRLARGEPLDYAELAVGAFDPEVLTIGFARRAAAYKRWFLLIHDRSRALGLLTGPTPMQLVLAGKAHPLDEEAKRILQSVFLLKGEGNVGERVAFLEDYDMDMAAVLVAGCDVWLNLPRAPLEASGTSGMKAAMNGGLNLSVLDGWWAEAYEGTNGWAISGEAWPDPAAQDTRDAAALYDLLEREVIPLFYDRDETGVPRGWIQMVKSSLVSVGPRYGAARMVGEYASRIYPAEGSAGDSVAASTGRAAGTSTRSSSG
jgi:starch phosphorylase